MNKKVQRRGRRYYGILMWILGLFLFTQKVNAEADFSDYENVRHPLIQATDITGEYKSLYMLGFLDTGTLEGNTEAAKTGEKKTENLSEYSLLLHTLQYESAYTKARGAIVQINIGEYYGSGVLWDLREETIVIVSNTHLLKEGESGQVTFPGGVSVQGTVKGVSETRDIGFLEVPLTALEREDWLLLRFADRDLENYETLLSGDALFVIGSANGAGADYYEGTIGNVSYYFPEFQSDMLYGYCKAVSGMSGGGTFDGDGKFIGMLTAGTKQDEIASLPVEIMVEEYEKIYGEKQE